MSIENIGRKGAFIRPHRLDLYNFVPLISTHVRFRQQAVEHSAQLFRKPITSVGANGSVVPYKRKPFLLDKRARYSIGEMFQYGAHGLLPAAVRVGALIPGFCTGHTPARAMFSHQPEAWYGA